MSSLTPLPCRQSPVVVEHEAQEEVMCQLDVTRSMLVFVLFREFCRRWQTEGASPEDTSPRTITAPSFDSEEQLLASLPDKDIVNLLHEKKLLSRRSLKLLVLLTLARYELLRQATTTNKRLFPLLLRCRRGQPYWTIAYTIEKYIELLADQGLLPGLPSLDMEGLSDEPHNDTRMSGFLSLVREVPSSQCYGLTPQETVTLCAACGHSKRLSLCTGCKQVSYCGKKCQDADWLRHQSHCHPVTRVPPPSACTKGAENASSEGLQCLLHAALHILH